MNTRERDGLNQLLSESLDLRKSPSGAKLSGFERVLFLGPHYDDKGGIASVLQLYRKYIPQFEFIATYRNSGLPAILFVFLGAILEFCWKLVVSPSVRIVHIHCSARGSFLRKSVFLLIAKLFRRKIIMHIHASDFHVFYEGASVLKRFVLFVLSSADCVVCVSNKWKRYFRRELRLRNVVVINNLTDYPQFFDRATSRDPVVNFLFLGKIGERKGIFDLLEVLYKNKHQFSGKLRLTIGGDGEVSRLKQLISLYELEEMVEFKGWISGRQKLELLWSCDVYILPSYNEGLPVSILEALSFGKAVVSTNVGGIPEVVRDNYNGWLFNAGDKKRLKAVISEAVADRRRLEKYGVHSLQLSKNHMPDIVMESLEELYKGLM